MKKIVKIMFVFVGLTFLVDILWLGFMFWKRIAAPSFTLQQSLSEDGQFMESKLSSGKNHYVSTAAEFGLQPSDKVPLINQIGKQDSQQVYSLPGNPDYVLLSGFMFPAQVFRSETVPPLDFGSLPIHEIELFGQIDNEDQSQSSRDPALIQEVASLLHQLQDHPTASPLPGKTTNMAQMRLYSDSLASLYYYLQVSLYPDGSIYFSFPSYPDHGLSAGPLFMQWAK